MCVKVAVWKAGDEHWSYSDSTPDIATCKACLDPYRAESKKILAIFKLACPDALLEKAGIDESFVDLSKVIHDRMLEEFKVLRLPPPYNDPLETLPLPDQTVLDWHGSHLVASEVEDAEIGEKEEDGIDWDDVAMAIGSKMVRFIRDEVKRELGYTCSAGISSNKMVAKLGSGFRKPNQQVCFYTAFLFTPASMTPAADTLSQSVVRPRAIKPFLQTFQFTKIRNLGGKLGTQISTHFNTSSLAALLDTPLQSFQAILPDDTATWVYNIIRGIDKSPLTARSAIKSMLSAKSFRPPYLPSNPTQAIPWLKVFVADIFARIEDESEIVPRRPKVMSLRFASKSGLSKQRQAPIPAGGILDKGLLFKVAENLLKQHVAAEGSAMWPCIRLSMNVSGFEEREVGNANIGAFLLRGQDALDQRERKASGIEKPARSVYTRDGRKRVVDAGITKFFGVRTSGSAENTPPGDEEEQQGISSPDHVEQEAEPGEDQGGYEIPKFPCEKCGVMIPIDEGEEHRDWHFAKDLEMQDRESDSAGGRTPVAGAPAPGPSNKRKGKSDPKLEKGQKRLAF